MEMVICPVLSNLSYLICKGIESYLFNFLGHITLELYDFFTLLFKYFANTFLKLDENYSNTELLKHFGTIFLKPL